MAVRIECAVFERLADDFLARQAGVAGVLPLCQQGVGAGQVACIKCVVDGKHVAAELL